MKFLVVVCLSIFVYSAQANQVREWWLQCNGNSAESTCLSDSEISRFKMICSRKNLRHDCDSIIAYVIAQTRIQEARKVLLHGHAAQIEHYASYKKYSLEIEKVWNAKMLGSMTSFVAGFLPACLPSGKTKLHFSSKLRKEVRVLRSQIAKIHNSLSSMPCPDLKNGFMLVAIGKVVDSVDEFEVFVIDEKKNFRVFSTALGAGPFQEKK